MNGSVTGNAGHQAEARGGQGELRVCISHMLACVCFLSRVRVCFCYHVCVLYVTCM